MQPTRFPPHQLRSQALATAQRQLFIGFFRSICSALKEKKYLQNGCLQCHVRMGQEQAFKHISQLSFSSGQGHVEQALCQGAETMKHLLVPHPDEHW